MKRRFILLMALIALPAAAQQRPVPDPRIEVALSTTAIKETERSTAFEKTMPQAGVRPRPRVDEPDMAKVGESVYIERQLAPRRFSDDPGAVHIRRSDR